MLVGTDWVKANLDNPQIAIVDIGTADEYARGHIPGARLIEPEKLIVNAAWVHDDLPSMRQLNRAITESGIANAQRIVIYSREPLLATRAFFTLDYAGLGNRIALVDGGFPKWNAEKQSVETGKPQPYTPVAFRGKENLNVFMHRLILKHRVAAMSVRLIDARPLSQYEGEEAGKDIDFPGHIPTAKCLPWNANLETLDNGVVVLRAPTTLREVYNRLGVNESTRPVVYCRTGMEASMTYFVLRYLGYSPALYDGSYVEWNTSGMAPIERKIASK